MPELPEVETVVRSLQPDLPGETITRIESPWPKAIATPELISSALHQQIQSISRRGKFIVLNLAKGALIVHLRMTGRLYTHLPDETQEPYITAIVRFQSGKQLTFQDTRKFGRIFYTTDLETFFEHLGPEPLGSTFTVEWLVRHLVQRKRIIKPLLLDQAFIAGLGNIYVDEALFLAGIHPLSLSNKIPANSVRKLHRAIRSLLQNAIAAQGTTIINFQHGDNKSGSFQHQLQVYGRANDPCRKCKTPIVKLVVGQRGTHVCLKCQELFGASSG